MDNVGETGWFGEFKFGERSKSLCMHQSRLGIAINSRPDVHASAVYAHKLNDEIFVFTGSWDDVDIISSFIPDHVVRLQEVLIVRLVQISVVVVTVVRVGHSHAK